MDVVIAQPSKDKLQLLPHRQYQSFDVLTPRNVAPSPLDQFRAWFTEAVEGGQVREPEVMCLSTATSDGIPSSRFVLLKQLDSKGFVFFTNYTSRKSQELAANPRAALAFYWKEVHRSVRIIGKVEKVSKEDSEAYFKSRPVGSQLGAWASRQSSIVEEGEVQARLEQLRERFNVQEQDQNANIPAPYFWGGWRVVPDEVEFWSGKPSRLHDRIRYLRVGDTNSPQWEIQRLAP